MSSDFLSFILFFFVERCIIGTGGEEMNERIKELRKTLDMTQGEFGKRLGIKGNSVSDIEKGKNNVTETMAKFICKEFKVREEWLRNGSGEMFVPENREDEISSYLGDLLKNENGGGFQQKLVHILSKLDVGGWEVLEKIANQIVEEIKKEP